MAARAPYRLSSYLRLAAGERGAWWRLLLGVLAATVGFFAVTLIALAIVALAVRLGGGHLVVDTNSITPELLLATNLGLAACIPLSMLLNRTVHGLRPGWLASVRPGLRRRWLGSCVAISAVVWGVLLLLAVVGVVAAGEVQVNSQVPAYLVIVLLTTPFQAAGEEYLFRGFLLQSLGATRLPAWICWVVSGALFATAHGQFAPPLFADRLIIGVVFAWLATSTGGLEASIAVHAIKNITVFIPAILLGELSGTIDPHGVNWAPVILDAVLLGVAAPWIVRRYRRQSLPPPPPETWPRGAAAGRLHEGNVEPGENLEA